MKIGVVKEVLAQGATQAPINLNPPAGAFQNLKNFSPGNILSGLIQLVLVVAAIVFFFFLVLGGIKWITSGGDKMKTESARQQITAALTGLIIVFATWAILQIIGNFFNINLINLTLNFG